MRFPSWPASTILALLDEATTSGSAEAETHSRLYADRARTAIYNYRRRNLAPDDPRQKLVVTVSETTGARGRVRVERIAEPALETIEKHGP